MECRKCDNYDPLRSPAIWLYSAYDEAHIQGEGSHRGFRNHREGGHLRKADRLQARHVLQGHAEAQIQGYEKEWVYFLGRLSLRICPRDGT